MFVSNSSKIALLTNKVKVLKRTIHRNRSSTTEISSLKSEFSQYPGGDIDLQLDSDIAIVRLSHRERKNAMSGHMMVRLHDISLELEKWSQSEGSKGLILTSDVSDVNPVFCSGGDISTVKKICNPDSGYRMSKLMHDTVLRLKRLPLISVCSVNGRAIGGGAELTLISDFRHFTPQGQIVFVQSRMGVANGWGGGKMLVDLIGQKKALQFLLTCEEIGPEKAEQLGMCDKIVSSVEETKSWLENLTGNLDSKVLKAAKNVIVNAKRSNCSIEDILEGERRIFSSVWGGEANVKALGDNLKH